jgi:hypothetical protein
MTEIQIQKASQEDVKTLVAIGKETFFEAFAESNTEADMKQYLEENFNEDKMRAELDDPGFWLLYCMGG